MAVLLASTILMTGAVAFAWFSRVQMKRLERETFAVQARSVARVVLQNIGRGLALDKNNYDSMQEEWFGVFLLPFADGWQVKLSLQPLNDRIPVNQLFLPDGETLRREMQHPWEETWKRLGRTEAASILLDFLDTNTESRLGSSEREFFPNGPVADISQFIECPEITEELLYGGENGAKGLADYVSLWSDGTVNVNIAPAHVLSLLDSRLDSRIAEYIVEERSDRPLRDWKDLEVVPGYPQELTPRLMNTLAFTSTHFEVQMYVEGSGGGRRAFRAVLAKDSRGVSLVHWEEM
ncbi:MAG: general secretion pathway protein GspK [Synergistales bacterium]|nr:general secretion pathway protein GspK [Synergistales bacterium]